MGLRVLITNIELWPPSGTVLYVRDLALELQRQGHTPWSSARRRAAWPRSCAAPASRSPTGWAGSGRRRTSFTAIITLPPWSRIRRWPTVPAIHVCHDHTSPNDRTPIHPNIRRHFGVSRVCVQRLVGDGVPESRADLLLNFVDTARFSPRGSLPERPRRALVFSNYAHEGSHLPAVMDACRQAGLELDVVGAGVGRIVHQTRRTAGAVRHRVRQGQGGDGGDGRRNGGHPVRLQRRRADGDVGPVRRVAAAQLRVRGAARAASARSRFSARSRATTPRMQRAFATCSAPALDWSPLSRAWLRSTTKR